MTCESAMTTNPCACGAAWVPETKLLEMAQDIKGSIVALPWEPRSSNIDGRRCPICTQEMLAVSLVGVELDRCAAHGVWFDAAELARVLESANRLPDRILAGPSVKLGHANSAPDTDTYRNSSSGSDWGILGAILDILDIATD